MKPVFMFSGQSSRYPEMIESLLARAPEVAEPIMALASTTLGRDLRAHFRPENPDIFATNQDVQVGVFLANHIHLCALEAAGLSADLSLGLSLGEYNHLVHIGALEFSEALRLVAARGAAYDAGPEGAMASVFPLDLEDLEEVVARVTEHGPLEISNLNSPSQNVISGSRAAIEAIKPILDEEHSCECVIIEHKIPMHASMFRPVATALRHALEAAAWSTPSRPYLPNVLAHFEDQPTSERIMELLGRHVYQPVLWRQSIEYIVNLHPDAVFIEVGPRSVLYNLLSRKWLKNERYRTDTPTGQPAAHAAVAMEVLRGS